MLDFKSFKILSEKASQQTVFTKDYMVKFLKDFGFTMIVYSPILKEMSILIKINGDKSNYEKMLNRLISLHYSDVFEVYTIKSGEEFKIFIKNF